METPLAPPKMAERLLAATVTDESWRDSILGDLREEYAMIRERSGERYARRWYWRHALAIGARGVSARIGLRKSSFPSLARTAEIDTRAGLWTGFTRDLHHAWRTLWRRPGTSAAIIVTLALALATNSASFALMDALVLRPFRFPGLDRLLLIASDDSNDGFLDRESVAPADFREWRRDARTVTHLSAAEWWDANLAGVDTPEQVPGFRVTTDFFAALGVVPVVGRTFAADEGVPGSHRRAILGHALWSRLFAADPAVVGRTVRLDGEPYEVVGIAPPNFALPDGAQVWSPLAYSDQQWDNRRSNYLVVVGRLADGASMEQARAEIGAIAQRQQREFPQTNGTRPNFVTTFTLGMRDPGSGPFIATMQGATLLLLLIACANIANLLLARGAERSQEFAMRLALGAGRFRLAWQLMIEAALLTALAIAVAIPIAWVFLDLARQSIPTAVIRFVMGYQYMDISPTVFWATAAFGALATLVFALVPALHTVRRDVADILRHGTRTATAGKPRQWLRNSLAAVQVAVTLALLFGSGLLLSAADLAINGALGFDKHDVLVAQMVLPERPYADGERRRQFITGVLDRLRVIPAVTTAAMTSNLPYAGGNSTRPFHPDGVPLEPRDVRTVDYRRITAEYFEAMRIPLVAGRLFTDLDRRGAQDVAIVSRSVAERYWPSVDPVGRKFRISPDGVDITVVGVVNDVVHDWFQQQRRPTVYRPLAQDASFTVAFVARTVGDPMSIASELRRAVRAQDPDQPINTLHSLEQHVEDRTAGLIFVARALGIVAAIALALALLGLYSVMAFLVSRRTQEMGVRMALGATAWQVVRLTTAHGARITIAGLVLGAAAAYGLGRLLEAVLFGAVANSVVQLAAIALVVGVVSVIATYLPARRTARLDPTTALRTE